jgi:predicted porin
MNRIFVAAALATLASSAAMAQSTVTVYGRLNLTLEKQDNNGSKIVVEQNNASRIGFKGTEDLGGGLKAGFQLEHGFSPDNGAPGAPFWGRQAEVNLSGGFGTVRMGTFTSEAYFATSDYIGMHNHETGTSSDALYAYIGRNINKLAYRSPGFVKGLSLEGAVSAGEGVRDGTVMRSRSYDFAGNYSLGALHVGLGYEKNGNAKQMAVSGLYEFGSFILGGLVQRDTNAYGSGNRTNFRVSAAYMLGASEFHLNVGKAGDYSNTPNSGAKQYTLAYNYNLSKRTKVYGYYTKIDAEARTGYASDFSSFALGVRHNF